MEKAYKFRLYPNKAQETLIHKTFGCARFVYNQTLAARRDAYAAGNPLSGYDCVKLLPGLKGTYSLAQRGGLYRPADLSAADGSGLQEFFRQPQRQAQGWFSKVQGQASQPFQLHQQGGWTKHPDI